MKMIQCKKCGKIYQKNLSNCPECFEKNKKYVSKGRKALGIIIIILGFSLFFSAVINWEEAPSDDYGSSITTTNSENEQSQKQNLYETKKSLVAFEGIDSEFVKLYDPKTGATAFALQLNLKNNGSEEVTVSLADGYINDTAIQFMTGLPVTIAPGKKAVGIYMFGYNNLGLSKIEEIQKVEFKIALLNNSFDLKKSEQITLNFK
jgi:predicted  nucleic acid-binding Zn-ribbon protein